MFPLLFVGFDPLLVGLGPRLGAIAASLGVLSHFTGIGRGVIDLRDAVYFVSLAGVFLVLTYFVLLRRKLTPRGAPLQRLQLGTLLLAAAVVVVNLFGRHIAGRIDLTPGRSFTLARATRKILGELPDLVAIKLFASSALPPEVAFLKRDVDDLLRDYRTAARPSRSYNRAPTSNTGSPPTFGRSPIPRGPSSRSGRCPTKLRCGRAVASRHCGTNCAAATRCANSRSATRASRPTCR